MARPDRPHFGFPFAHGHYVEQDSPEHVMSCVNVIARCPLGWRIERPDFGIPWPEYATTIDEAAILSAIRSLDGRSGVSAEQVRSIVGDALITVTVEAG